MTKQYKDNGPAPAMVANVQDKKEKDLTKQIRDLKDKVNEQDSIIQRMHRDIVRLRVAINEVSARIK